MITDAWVPSPLGALINKFHASLSGRFHPDLDKACVRAFTMRRVVFDLWLRFRGISGWAAMNVRDQWFQQNVVRELCRLEQGQLTKLVFSYSYSAKTPFQWARDRGIPTVLCQIDPGPEEQRWVCEQVAKEQDSAADLGCGPPLAYWERWRREIELADCILVNSEWSKKLLERGGVPAEKTKIVPLAYERSADQRVMPTRRYPDRFVVERPLKVLFLGQVILRKGVIPLLKAAVRLEGSPVEFLMAGPDPEGLLYSHAVGGNVRKLGAVDRILAEQLYSDADVFILPTYSDGFAITQLEAAAHRLPLIVSRYCGEVVEEGRNGWVLPEVNANCIVDVLEKCLGDPSRLEAFSAYELDWERFSLETLGKNLQEAEEQARRFAQGSADLQKSASA
ncbi:MAG: glycosyltransferase family 4 protein [Verrucomicrobiota bacterium]